VIVDLHDLRIGGAVMLAGAVLLPVLPGPNGLPCPLRALTGVPCPLCGMTTSVTAAVHLDPVAALAANPAGVVAVAVAAGLLAFRRRSEVTVPPWGVAVLVALMWGWQLARLGLSW
jgi:hypothetical protein